MYPTVDFTDGSVTIDAEKTVTIGWDDDIKSDTNRAYPFSFVPRKYEGIEIKDVRINKVNGATWNVCAIFSNSSDKDVEFDVKGFTFMTADGEYKLLANTWPLWKNHSYIWWATSALSNDFISALKVGEKVTVIYDGEEIGDIVTTTDV